MADKVFISGDAVPTTEKVEGENLAKDNRIRQGESTDRSVQQPIGNTTENDNKNI